jgi:hypothetical protein
MEETDPLDFLIGAQARSNAVANWLIVLLIASFAAELYRLADEMEPRLRELDRL